MSVAGFRCRVRHVVRHQLLGREHAGYWNMLSSNRRSRFVGRPLPLSRARSCWTLRSRAFSNSSLGVRSAQKFGTSLAPTREGGTPTTRRVRSTSPCRTVTVSPGRTSRAGLAGSALTATLPARHASLARLRLLKMRTAHSHLSRRPAESMTRVLNGGKQKRPRTLSNAQPSPLAKSKEERDFRHCFRTR
jgi:hypothetical protein